VYLLSEWPQESGNVVEDLTRISLYLEFRAFQVVVNIEYNNTLMHCNILEFYSDGFFTAT
jgi:hypothetical protein